MHNTYGYWLRAGLFFLFVFIGTSFLFIRTAYAVNSAPVLDATRTPYMVSIDEDADAPSGIVGSSVTYLVDGTPPAGGLDNVTDANGTSSIGIAITAIDPSLTCYYSLSGGGSWDPIGSVSSSNALLLAWNFNNRIYCAGGLNANGTFTSVITFRAWDQSTGVDGEMADTTSNGGTTAFSTATDTAVMTINAVNDAPVLDASKTPVFMNAFQNVGSPSGNVGTLVSSLVDFATPAGQVDNVVDVDSASLIGIAITAADASHATYYYSLNNGTTWNALGAMSDSSSRLLAANSGNRIYIQPDPGFSGSISPAITFRVWDQTSGTNGFTVDTSTNGGTTAFSSTTDTAGITIVVNAAPNATNLSAAETYTEDTSLNLIDIVASDTDTAILTATLTLSNPSAGNLSTATAGSVTSTFASGLWTASGAIASVNTLLAGVTFNPAANFNDDLTIATRVSDGNSSVTGTKTVTGIAVADAPVAVDDEYTIDENVGEVLFDVLANDYDVDSGDTIAIGAVGGGSHGVIGNQGSDVSYESEADFCGTDSFNYTVVSSGGGSPVTGTVTVHITCADDTLPDTFLTTHIASSISEPVATFTFESNEDPSTFECKLDDDSFVSCVSPYETPELLAGPHTFAVRAIDGADNIDASPATLTWTIYDSVPEIISTSPSNEATNVAIDTNIIFNFSETVPEALQDHMITSASPCGDEGCPTLEGRWSNDGKKLTYTNSNDFDKNTEYTIDLQVNNSLTDSLYNLSFTTSAGKRSSGGSRISYVPPAKNPVPLLAITKSTFVFTRNLQLGMSGTDVKKLQEFFVAQAKGPAALALQNHGTTDYFGPLTKQAVSEYQVSQTITPSIGFFGPITRGVVNGN